MRSGSLVMSCVLSVVVLLPSHIGARVGASERDGAPHGGGPTRGVLRVSASPVALGGVVVLSGRFPGRGRELVVERRVGDAWRTVTRARSGPRGQFVVRLRPRHTMVVRARARPAAGRVGALTSPARITVVRQTGRLVRVPPLADPGPTPRRPRGIAQVVATFTPPLPGGTVHLDRLTMGGWVRTAEAAQNDAGSAFFTVTPGSRYRARTGSGSGAASTGWVKARTFELQFAEDFEATAADGRSPLQFTDQWRPAIPGRTCSSLSEQPRHVSGGVLHLRVVSDPAKPEPCQYVDDGREGVAPHLLSTQVATSRTFSFTHGYAAARIKMHSHSGAHAGFWLLPAKLAPDGTPEWHDTSYVLDDPSHGLEIDVAEFWGERQRNGNEATIASFLHWFASPPAFRRSLGGLYPGTNAMRGSAASWTKEFHVFSVRWSPTSYEFMVDGQVFARETRAVSQVPQYPVLSMHSSDYELDRLTPALFGDSAQVDWVRVWSL